MMLLECVAITGREYIIARRIKNFVVMAMECRSIKGIISRIVTGSNNDIVITNNMLLFQEEIMCL